MSKVKHRRYNRFLHSDEQLPRSTSWRRSKKKDNNLLPASRDDIPSTSMDQDYKIDETQSSTEDNFDTGQSFESDSEGGNIYEEETVIECKIDDPASKFKDTHFQMKNGSDPLFSQSNVTTLEAYISILAFSLRFNLSRTCMKELLQLIELLLPSNNLPSTEYMFYRQMESAFDNVCEVHIYCVHCQSYICTLATTEKPDVCTCCNEVFNPDEAMKQGSFFLYMPLKPQLKVKFEKQNVMDDITKYRSDFEDGLGQHYKDILDGDMYRSMSTNFTANDISIQFNVDGIPIYRKSQYNIWPIQCLINELSPSKRKEHLMMCGLWFGTSKPEMNENFLKPFVDELSQLSQNGFLWENQDIQILTKVFPFVCTSDAPARAMLQNFLQFNGKFGCGFCEAEGERTEKGKGYCRVYPVETTLSSMRTCESTIEYADIAHESGKAYRGVKGPSTLMRIYPYFDMVRGFVPDYMHAVLLGVTRQFACLWIDTSGFIYSLNKASILILDKNIKNIKFPHETTRKLRPTKDIMFWKASEWRVFLLVSPVILKTILDKKVYKHWLLFVHGIKLLSSENVSAHELLIAEMALTKFVSEVSSIYGLSEQSYNVHLLLHLPFAVRSWGPLWAHSCFVYEDSLGKLKTFHHGTNAVPSQILSSYLHRVNLKMLINGNSLQNPQISGFVDKMQRGHSLTQKALQVSGCTLFGYPKLVTLTRIEQNEVQKISNANIKVTSVNSYNRILFDGKVYSTKEYCAPFTRADYIVSVKSGIQDTKSKIEISRIIVFKGEVFFVGQKISCTQFSKKDSDVGKLCSDIVLTQCNDDDFVDYSNIVAFRPSDVTEKCIISVIQDCIYLIPLINACEQ